MFYDINEYTFLKKFKENYSGIKEELLSVIDKPLTELHKSTWANERENYLNLQNNSNASWKTYVFKFFGIKHLPNLESCPLISKLINETPEIVTIEFSMLESNTHILPHRGYSNLLLRSHLGLIVPEGDVAIKVQEDVRKWNEGDFLIFDDSLIHEAWNFTNKQRVVLMIDFVIDPKSNSNELALDLMKRTTDKYILDLAPREDWISWVKQGFFPKQ